MRLNSKSSEYFATGSSKARLLIQFLLLIIDTILQGFNFAKSSYFQLQNNNPKTSE